VKKEIAYLVVLVALALVALFLINFGITGFASRWSSPTSSASVTGFILVDGRTGADIGPLVNGQTVKINSTSNYLIKAITSPTIIYKVSFSYNGASLSDSSSPYMVALKTTTGAHTLSATPYSSRKSKGSTYTIRFNVNSSVFTTNVTQNYSDPTPNPIVNISYAKRVLIVYNLNSNESIDLKNYYIQNRPGFADANVLGVSVPAVERINQNLFETNLRKPVADWITSHPSTPIYYIVLMRGIPDRTFGTTSYSVDYQLSTALSSLGIRYGTPYGSETTQPYSPTTYAGTTALIMHMDMGSSAATKAYINKLNSTYNKMANPNVIISGENAGISGTNYLLDDSEQAVYSPYKGSSSINYAMISSDKLALTSSGVPSSRIFYANFTSPHVTSGVNVRGYETWGANGGLGGNYANDGKIVFRGNSSWFLIKTIESFNGQWVVWQGNFVDWYAANAFGGTNYSNAPIGAVTHVEEPLTTGVNGPSYLKNWEAGMLLSESAWSSRRTPFYMAVGDPLVKK
jgi:hypothetical protein